MCNINVVLNRGKKLSMLPSMYMNVASYNSFTSNKDGEGMIGYRNKHIEVRKRLKKIVYREQYWLLATHQRLATSGVCDFDNTHPIVTEHLMVLHNGIFSALGDREFSDTYHYAQKLESAYIETGDLLRAINKVHEDVTGSWSVVVYVRGTGKFYYYKNSGSSMHCVMDTDWLVLSTSRENIAYAKRFFKLWKAEQEIEDNLLYELTDGLRIVGRVEAKAQSVSYGDWVRSDSGIWRYNKAKQREDTMVSNTEDAWQRYFSWSRR